jgi:hypothetical protein
MNTFSKTSDIEIRELLLGVGNTPKTVEFLLEPTQHVHLMRVLQVIHDRIEWIHAQNTSS